MATRAPARLLACVLAALSVALSMAASAGGARQAACAAERDRRIAAIEDEALSVAVAFDADAAVMEAPEYQLLKDKDALLREIAEERQAVWEQYRRCAAGDPAR